MQQLLVWKRVVFVDWHGVLSRDPFWLSILQREKHPLRPVLQAKLGQLFSTGSTVHEWMKGLRTSDEVIAELGIETRGNYRNDFLAKRLDADCFLMRVDGELVELLKSLKAGAFVVLATDNMDCFARAFEYARSKRKRARADVETFSDWATICDDIVCSSDVGALKSEDAVGFFGTWLREHGLSFDQAVLIDDREDNCRAFTAQGGLALQWKIGDPLTGVASAVERWLSHEIHDVPAGSGR